MCHQERVNTHTANLVALKGAVIPFHQVNIRGKQHAKGFMPRIYGTNYSILYLVVLGKYIRPTVPLPLLCVKTVQRQLLFNIFRLLL